MRDREDRVEMVSSPLPFHRGQVLCSSTRERTVSPQVRNVSATENDVYVSHEVRLLLYLMGRTRSA